MPATADILLLAVEVSTAPPPRDEAADVGAFDASKASAAQQSWIPLAMRGGSVVPLSAMRMEDHKNKQVHFLLGFDYFEKTEGEALTPIKWFYPKITLRESSGADSVSE